MINMKDFDSNLLKIDKKSNKNIDIYYFGYLTMKNCGYVKINRNEILKLHNITIVNRSVFQEDSKYYPQVFLDECLYEL